MLMVQEFLDKLVNLPTKEKIQESALQEEFAVELGKSLTQEYAMWVRSLPQEIFVQIEALHQPSILNPDQNKSHWKYELNMIRSVVAVKDAVLQFFEVDEGKETEFLQELIFMIIVSDVGKAGPRLYNPKHAASVVPRIYNNLILEKKHGEAVREICMQALFNEKVFDEQKTTWDINRILRKNSGFFSIAPLKRIFSKFGSKDKWKREKLKPQLAAFLEEEKALSMPIELAMIVARQIARSETDDISKREEIGECLKLGRNEITFLNKNGFNVETTPIGFFYSKGHIVFGKEFLLSLEPKLGERLTKSALLGLQHHFVQGVSIYSTEEVTVFIERSKTEVSLRRDIKMIAFTEMLDKVEAAMHRPSSTNPFSLEDPKIFLEAIKKSIEANYSEHAEHLFSIYQEVFIAMRQMGIFEKVRETGK